MVQEIKDATRVTEFTPECQPNPQAAKASMPHLTSAQRRKLKKNKLLQPFNPLESLLYFISSPRDQYQGHYNTKFTWEPTLTPELASEPACAFEISLNLIPVLESI